MRQGKDLSRDVGSEEGWPPLYRLDSSGAGVMLQNCSSQLCPTQSSWPFESLYQAAFGFRSSVGVFLGKAAFVLLRAILQRRWPHKPLAANSATAEERRVSLAKGFWMEHQKKHLTDSVQ